MKRYFIFLALAALHIAPIGSASAQTVATVNGVAITEAELAAAVKQAGLPESAESRAAFKNQLIARELFRQQARKNNFTARPEAKQAADQARDAVAIQLYLRDGVKPRPVTEAEMKARYDAIVGWLGEKEMKPRLISVADAATAQSVLAQLKSGADFARLAREHSKAPSASRGGELDWVSFKQPLMEGNTQNYPLVLADAIVKLPAGAVSAEPIAVNNQHFLIKVDEVRPTVVPQYEQVKPAIRQLLEQQEIERASAAFVVDLIKKAKIQR